MRIFRDKSKRLLSIIRPLLSLSIALAFALSLTGCFLLPEDDEVLASPVVLKEPVVQKITTEKVRRGNIEKKIKFWGAFMSPVESNLFFSNMGRLKSVNVAYGDYVQAGEELASLESEDLDMQLAQLEISLKKAELNYDRLKEEYGKDGSNKYELEDAKLGMDSIELSIAGVKNDLSKVTITSPISGFIAFIDPTGVGQFITPRSTFITVCDRKDMVLVVKESKVKESLALGKEVSVSYNGKTYNGKVLKTPDDNANEKDPNFQNAYTIKVEGLDTKLVNLNDTASVEYLVQKADNVLIIDKAYVNVDSGKSYVFVYKDGAIEEREVETGIESDDGVDMEITKGLTETDDILVQ